MSYNIEIPDSLKPTQEMYENARDLDENFYKKTYAYIKEHDAGITPSEIIELMAEIVAERVALEIGFGLTKYDIRILRGVAERHITSVVNEE